MHEIFPGEVQVHALFEVKGSFSIFQQPLFVILWIFNKSIDKNKENNERHNG